MELGSPIYSDAMIPSTNTIFFIAPHFEFNKTLMTVFIHAFKQVTSAG